MEDYFIIKSKDSHAKATVDNSKVVSAKNIDNLRKNISKELAVGEMCTVRAFPGRFLGVLGHIGKKTVSARTKEGKIIKSTWPEFLWIAHGKDYVCDPKTGKIRRM